MNLLYTILEKKDFAEQLKALSDVYTAVDLNQVVKFDKKTVQEADGQQERIVLAPIGPNEPMLLKVASESSGKIKVDMKSQSIFFQDCEIQESLSNDNLEIQA
jgi:3'-phosphoadenosine 5'-phosphosulfate (PAPS) 3'-phosphatase